MNTEKLLRKTKSLCPECLKILPAEVFERDKKVWIKKTCKEHGDFEEIYWSDSDMYKRAESFAGDARPLDNPHVTKENPTCPKDCGLCKNHGSMSSLTNIVLTNRCDLNCWYCFFYAKKAGYIYEPTIEQIKKMLESVRNEKPLGCNAIQYTGGEPTMREDIVEIVKMTKDMGFSQIQINTDGIRLSQNPQLAKDLTEAGANLVYLSFDGTTPETNPKNHWEIPQALDNCRATPLPKLKVILVPTVINGVNDHQLGDILRFAGKHNDIVRSVNFQPISLVGRMPKNERDKCRITIPDVIHRLEEQTNGEFSRDDFFPIPVAQPLSNFVEQYTGKARYELGSHFACGMATFAFNDNGKFIPIPRFFDVRGFFEYLGDKAEDLKQGKSKTITGAKMLYKLNSFLDKDKMPKDLKISKLLYNVILKNDYKSLGVFTGKTLFVGMMHFQDLYNYDIQRVNKCCIHYAVPDGRVIPFCSFNVIPEWYRDKIQKKYSLSIPEWEKKTGRKLEDDMYKRKLPKTNEKN